MAWFSRGFFRLHEEDGTAFITDLRMGQEPNYSFSFRVAQRGSEFAAVTPQNQGRRGDVNKALAWLGPRMLGHDLPPPR
jgi:inner membrane protein